MKSYKKSKHPKILKLVFSFTILGCFNYSFSQSRSESSKINVKVLIKEVSFKNKQEFIVESENQLILSGPKTKKRLLVKNKKLKIIAKDDSFFVPLINPITKKREIKKINPKEVKISSTKGYIKIFDHKFPGSINLTLDSKKNNILVINKLNLNNYIKGVLPSEIYLSWPLEMQKVQAVVSRTYVVHHIIQSRKNKKPYDVKNNNFHQKYSGFNSYKSLEQAIKDTKDLVMTYKDKIVLAMFDACCGGITPSKMSYLDFKKAEYLARNRICNFCKNYKLYKWHKEISEASFLEKIKRNYGIKRKLNNSGRLLKIEVHKKDSAGIAKSLKLFCSKKNIIISALDIQKCLNNIIKSLNFDIKKNKNKIIIDGKGFGHQLGLCQRGARELVERGWNFKNIIRFYYPGIKFAKLKRLNKNA